MLVHRRLLGHFRLPRPSGELAGRPLRGWTGFGLTGTFETPDDLAESGIAHVADRPMDGRPFDIRAKQATLAAIPYRVELNGIATMLIRHHEAAQ